MLTREVTVRLKLGREDVPASQLEETKGETGTKLSAGLTEKATSVPLCCQSTLQLADSVSNEAERKVPGRSARLRPSQVLGPGTALEQASENKIKWEGGGHFNGPVCLNVRSQVDWSGRAGHLSC